MITLDDYLDFASRQPWAWGRPAGDCIQFGLGWVSARLGRVLAAPLVYSDAKTATAFLDARGGFICALSQWMEAHGFPPTDTPDDGDIGVAPMEGKGEYHVSGYCVVIRRGPWWIGKALHGYAGFSVQGIPAWRIS